MPLYIMSPYPSTVQIIQNDLLAMVNYSSNFGSENIGGKIRVYVRSPDSSVPQQLMRRANEAPYPIFIVGRNYSDTTDGGILKGLPNATISQLGGGIQHANYGAHDPSDPNAPITSIEVEYDASGCNGQGYWVRAADLTKAPSPPYLVLAHELGHIFGAALSAAPATGGLPLDQYGNPTYGFGETDAIKVENFVRKLYGCPQRSTDGALIGDGGCGYQGPSCNPPLAPKTGTSWGRLCFVVTAAHGGQATPVLNGLRTLREWLLKSSRLGAQLFADFDEQYYRTSPTISADMLRDPALRLSIRTWLVEPLTTFLAAAFGLVSRDRLASFPDLLRTARPSWPRHRVQLAARLLGCLRRHDEDESEALSADPLCDAYRYLRTTLQSYPSSPSMMIWALLEPLEYVWTRWAEGEHDPWDGLEKFVCQWLGAMPLPSEYDRQSPDDLSADLHLLKARVFTDELFFQALVVGLGHGLAGSDTLMRVVESARKS